MAKNVVGLFDTQQDARNALEALRNEGFPREDISFVANNARGEYGDVTTTESGTEAEEGAGIGATGGAVLGGLAGLLVGLGIITIPGIGPAVVAGGLGTALASTALGAGIGAAAGGLVGALVGAGIPEEDANIYAEGVRRGGALVSVQVASNEDANRAAAVMDRYNVVDIDSRGQEYRSSGWTGFDESDNTYTTTGRDYGATGGDADTNIGRDDWDRSSKLGTAGGGVAGAATGAAIGSAGGPVGTVVGGVAGAVAGGGVGAAGDAAGAEATDDNYDRGTSYDATNRTTGTSYGSTTDYSTTGTTDYNRANINDTTLQQGGEVKVPIVEEELRVGKREVEGGGVRVNTHIEETPVNEQVTLREETVDVHRRPVDRPVSDADITNFQEGTFEVRERAEEAVVDKQARVVEEVHVKKDVQDHTETIQDTVRRTDVDVEQLPGHSRTVGTTDTDLTNSTGYNQTGLSDTNVTSDQDRDRGFTDRIERGTGLDVDLDGDVDGTPKRDY